MQNTGISQYIIKYFTMIFFSDFFQLPAEHWDGDCVLQRPNAYLLLLLQMPDRAHNQQSRKELRHAHLIV